ncbi:MAG: hypothetical protein IKM11_02620 [Oscillospiraceae bacterium]|nr:hypothetical protein [Oscillospiraceae bacterium]
MKKLFALILSCAMVLGLAATAFAEDVTIEDPNESGVYSQETTITGATQAPTIKVTVPSTGDVVINPYGMKYGADDATDKIISAAQYIKNESNVDISISVTVTGQVDEGSNAVLATAALKGTETTKSVFLYFEILEAVDGETEPTWAEAYSKDLHVIAAAKATTKAGVHVMKAGDEAATFAAFHLAGDVASAPATPWADTDTVSVVIAFTFNPVVSAEGAEG